MLFGQVSRLDKYSFLGGGGLSKYDGSAPPPLENLACTPVLNEEG